jgi:hypothetical protein
MFTLFGVYSFGIFPPTKYLHIQSTTVYVPSSELGLPQPLSASECALPPGPKGGGAHPPAPKGVGEFQFRRWRKSLALCLLWDFPPSNHAKLLLIGCTSWFDSKRWHLPTWLANLLKKWCFKHKKIKKDRCGKHLAIPTLFGRSMTIYSAEVSGKGNRINSRWRPN